MFSDIFESIHADDLGSIVGEFHGEPVREWDRTTSIDRADRDARLSVKMRTGDSLPHPKMVADLETKQYEVCADNMLRKDTTAEAIGYDKFHNSALNATGRRVSIDEAQRLAAEGALINWRPDGVVFGQDAYALVVGEEEELAVAA